MELKSGTLEHLQEYIGEKIKQRGFEDEPLNERLLMLAEEVGELVKACRKLNGMYVDQNKEIVAKVGEEVADVLNMLFAVAIELGLDMEKEFKAKEKIIDERVYARGSALNIKV